VQGVRSAPGAGRVVVDRVCCISALVRPVAFAARANVAAVRVAPNGWARVAADLLLDLDWRGPQREWGGGHPIATLALRSIEGGSDQRGGLLQPRRGGGRPDADGHGNSGVGRAAATARPHPRVHVRLSLATQPTPSLPWNDSGNWSQPTATVWRNFAVLGGVAVAAGCHRLRPLRSICSILRCLLRLRGLISSREREVRCRGDWDTHIHLHRVARRR
jgi:hypothetical protein